MPGELDGVGGGGAVEGLTAVAADYAARGWRLVLVPRGAKVPRDGNWQDRTYRPEDFAGSCNIGVRLGLDSGGLTDVDLDCEEAIHFAKAWLPPTAAVFGRDGQATHYLYVTDMHKGEGAAMQYRDPSRKHAMIVEVRAGGNGRAAHTVFPGSVLTPAVPVRWHNGCGFEGAIPAKVDAVTLKAAVAKIAIAVLLVRNWPENGGRHHIGGILGGVLGRAGWSLKDVKEFVKWVAACAGDEEAGDRAKFAESSFQRLASGGKDVMGLPSLMKHTSREVGARVAEWLGLKDETRVSNAKKLTAMLDSLDVEVWVSEGNDAYATVAEGIAEKNYKIGGKYFNLWG